MNLTFNADTLALAPGMSILASTIGLYNDEPVALTLNQDGELAVWGLDGNPGFSKDVSNQLDLTQVVDLVHFENYVSVFNLSLIHI